MPVLRPKPDHRYPAGTGGSAPGAARAGGNAPGGVASAARAGGNAPGGSAGAARAGASAPGRAGTAAGAAAERGFLCTDAAFAADSADVPDGTFAAAHAAWHQMADRAAHSFGPGRRAQSDFHHQLAGSFAFSLPTIGPAFAIAFFSTIALIVLAVVTIILLVRRKKAGCFCVYALYAVQVLANIVVLFAYLDFGMDVLSIILSILIGAVMLAVNVVYFGKRKHMFS